MECLIYSFNCQFVVLLLFRLWNINGQSMFQTQLYNSQMFANFQDSAFSKPSFSNLHSHHPPPFNKSPPDYPNPTQFRDINMNQNQNQEVSKKKSSPLNVFNILPQQDRQVPEHLFLKSIRMQNQKRICSSFADEEDIQDSNIYKGIKEIGIVKGPWTDEQDSRLMEAVQKNGAKNWSKIAKQMEGRVGKQCRQRWHNHLNPNIKKDKWTEQEDEIIIECHRKFGNKWAVISKYLSGRTDNAIKNHWNSTIQRKLQGKLLKKECQQEVQLLTPMRKERADIYKQCDNLPTSEKLTPHHQSEQFFSKNIKKILFHEPIQGSVEKQTNKREELPNFGEIRLIFPLVAAIKVENQGKNSQDFLKLISQSLQAGEGDELIL